MSIKKNNAAPAKTVEISEVDYKEIPSEPLKPSQGDSTQTSSEKLIQLLIGLAMEQFTLGKTQDEVTSFIVQKGAQMDVATMIANMAKEALDSQKNNARPH